MNETNETSAGREEEVNPECEALALADLYQKLTPADFSRDILEHIAADIRVMPMPGITWFDWGRPQRTAESVVRLKQQSAFGHVQAGHALRPAKGPPMQEIAWHETKGRKVMERRDRPCARYGIEIRGLSLHAEADDLAHISALLDGHAGRVHVIDRQSSSLLFEGSADDVRKALAAVTARSADGPCAEPVVP